MIEFQMMTSRSQPLAAGLGPPLSRRQGRTKPLREAIQVLVENPRLPCVIGDLVPDGFGTGLTANDPCGPDGKYWEAAEPRGSYERQHRLDADRQGVGESASGG